MGNTLQRLLICALVLVCCGVIFWMESLFEVTVHQPSVDIKNLSMELSEWRGETVPMDEEIVRFAGAGSSISRIYNRAGEVPVAVYGAVWDNRSIIDDIAPHPPTVCYPNAGWTLERQKVVQIDGSIDMCLSEFSRAGDKLVTAHWYQLGDLRYSDALSTRASLISLWGKKEWSPVVKILLQTQAPSIEDAQARLVDIANEVNPFVSTIR
ncbi:exosortase C-terminal domain/associated protein EpsI [Blastopirellula marina]|uniref:EpsI family protein n=1 Tax=Blastopirellula marina TaxID=124 RepID=A0A2S8GLW7_9BACT|nr:exosortase C-terminal domain/associated protein EpsI [Blastopirellula marina]PQO45425.1 EpsI family protein [Blastopirellula marina]